MPYYTFVILNSAPLPPTSAGDWFQGSWEHNWVSSKVREQFTQNHIAFTNNLYTTSRILNFIYFTWKEDREMTPLQSVESHINLLRVGQAKDGSWDVIWLPHVHSITCCLPWGLINRELELGAEPELQPRCLICDAGNLNAVPTAFSLQYTANHS